MTVGGGLRERARAAWLLALLVAGCAEESAPVPAGSTDSLMTPAAADSRAKAAFELIDVTAELGLEFLHDNGFRGRYHFPETFGSGVALIDANGDGRLDVYCVQSGPLPGAALDPSEPGGDGPRPTNELWCQTGAGRFEDRTAASGDAADAGFGMGVAAGDVNGDGRVDLYVTNWGPDSLLLNRGDGRFEHPAGSPRNERWSTATGFADLDRDGHLDLVAVNYLHWSLALHRDCDGESGLDYCDVSLFDGLSDRVWRGDGQGGFEDRSKAWGLADRRGKGLGLALVDLDDDGDVDLYVANDTEPNFLWLNAGDGRLVDASDQSGASYGVDGRPQAGMGVAVADLDSDGLPELHVTNFTGESNALYANQGGGHFRDRARQAGLTAPSRNPLGFGTVFEDLDGDGHLDLYVTNGHVLRNVGQSREAWKHAQPDLVFRGTPRGRFSVWDAGEAPRRATVGRGVAAGDLDSDGRLELVISESGGPLRVLSARPLPGVPGTSGAPRRLRVELRGRGTNTLAIGARVSLRFNDDSVQHRWVRSGTGYLSQSDLAPSFALPVDRTPLTLDVRWPDGATSTVERLPPSGGSVRVVQH